MKGTKNAEAEDFSWLWTDAREGTLIDPSKVTVADYLRSWLDRQADLAGQRSSTTRYLRAADNSYHG